MGNTKRVLNVFRSAGLNPVASKLMTKGFRKVSEICLTEDEKENLRNRLSPYTCASEPPFEDLFKVLEDAFTIYHDQKKVREALAGGALKQEKRRLLKLEKRTRAYVDYFVNEEGFELRFPGPGPHLLLPLRKLADAVESLEEARFLLREALKEPIPPGYPKRIREVHELAKVLKAPYAAFSGQNPEEPTHEGKGLYREFFREILRFLGDPSAEVEELRVFIP